jgi:hypothetical protein
VSRYVWKESSLASDEAYELVDTHTDQTIAMVVPDEGEYELFFFSRKHLEGEQPRFSSLEEAQTVSLAIVTLT